MTRNTRKNTKKTKNKVHFESRVTVHKILHVSIVFNCVQNGTK